MKYHNIEIESAIIGSILVRPTVIEDVINEITPYDLQNKDNKILLWVIYKIYNDGNPIELNTIIDYLKRGNKYNGVKEHLLDIAQDAGTSAGIEYYVQQIKDGRTKAQLVTLIEKLNSNLKSELIPLNTSYEDIIKFLDTADKPIPKQESIPDLTRKYVDSANGIFYLNDVYTALSIRDRKDKHSVVVTLSRLVEKTILEKAGRRSGCYRKINNEFEIVQFTDIDDEEERLDIRLPFGMERYLEVYPKDMVVYSGQPQIGKTAIMFECIRLNFRRHKVFYFTKEMSKRQVLRRVKKYKGDKAWDFSISDDFENFTDILQPNAINIVDYLEVEEGEFYKIPGMLTQIHNKLKKLNSIAIVALQKNPEIKDQKTGKTTKNFAIGGAQTLAKPVIFCTLTPNYPNGAIMRIEKGKNPTDQYEDGGVDGWEIGYKIVKGINLHPQGIWEPELKI